MMIRILYCSSIFFLSKEEWVIKLNSNQAKTIVSQVMKVIPYNINIMDDQGIIIGSGDKKRLDQIHIGAIKALQDRRSIEVFIETENIRPGINIPIFFQDDPVGVIGITGDPHIVRPFGELVRVMAELLVNQDYILNQRGIKKQQIEEFLYNLAYKTTDYTDEFSERGRSLGIDLSIPRLAIVLNFKEEYRAKIEKKLVFQLKATEYYFTIDPENIAVFIEDGSKLTDRLESFFSDKYRDSLKIGVGFEKEIIAVSLDEANRALKIGKKLEAHKSIYKYEDLYFLSLISKVAKDKKIITSNNKLSHDSNLELLNTLIVYIRQNGEIKETYKELHIHRNTLNYRLEKIKEITGKDPRNYKDLLELFIIYIASDL